MGQSQGAACFLVGGAMSDPTEEPIDVADAKRPQEVTDPDWGVAEEDLHISGLCYQASIGRADCVEMLLVKGVNPRSMDYDRRSALHAAVAGGHIAVIEMLIQARAEVNAENRRGQTPLDEVAGKGSAGVREVLLAAGALSGSEASTELSGSAMGRSSKMQQLDSSGSIVGFDSAFAVACAASAGQTDVLQQLLTSGLDPDLTDYDGRAGLHVAAAYGHVEVVRWLAEARANVNLADSFGRTPLSEAQRLHNVPVAEVLVEYGAKCARASRASFMSGSEGAGWAIPGCEITIGEELSTTMKSVVSKAMWRGTAVVCKTVRSLPLTAKSVEMGEDSDVLEQELVREIRLLSTIRHPDLVLFLGACVDHAPPLLITEFLPGGDLERHYRARSAQNGSPYLPPKRKMLKWASSVARALAFLHESSRPIIHRDLKPLNLLLNEAEDLKVTDFGLSKLMDTQAVQSRMSGGIGTYRYMAPEVVRYEQYTDRVDIYSFAFVLWFMCTSQQPLVRELGKDPEEVLREYVQGREPRPDPRAMKCPAALRSLAVDCWHVDAGSRPSALECSQRLTAAIASHHGGPIDVLKDHFALS